MPDFIPWAWGINGCASVVSGILATLLAVHLGFNVVVGLAAGLYLFAALLLRDPTERRVLRSEMQTILGCDSVTRTRLSVVTAQETPLTHCYRKDSREVA